MTLQLFEPRMIFIHCLFFSLLTHAWDNDSSNPYEDTDTWGKSIDTTSPEPKPVPPPQPSPAPRPESQPQTVQGSASRPTMRPQARIIEQDADPGLPTEGVPFEFENIRARDLNTPIIGEFQKLFRRCAPAGCTAGTAYVCRGDCHTHEGSCHNSGEALDLMSIRCNGRLQDASSRQYRELVQCARGQRIEKSDRAGKSWKVLYQENESNRRGCGGVNSISHPKTTMCHWDHAHFSIHCRRGGGWSW